VQASAISQRGCATTKWQVVAHAWSAAGTTEQATARLSCMHASTSNPWCASLDNMFLCVWWLAKGVACSHINSLLYHTPTKHRRTHTLTRSSRRAATPLETSLCQHAQCSDSQNDVEGSLADFDRALAASPQLNPYLWQRGLSLYYLQQYTAGAKQFR
jgi:hypothetical protein